VRLKALDRESAEALFKQGAQRRMLCRVVRSRCQQCAPRHQPGQPATARPCPALAGRRPEGRDGRDRQQPPGQRHPRWVGEDTNGSACRGSNSEGK